MGLVDIVRIFSFLLGTALQISILVLTARRRSQQGREIIFALFTFVVLGWSFSIFISLFCGYLYHGKNIVEHTFAAVAAFSFTLVFPLLIHTLVYFAQGKYFHISGWLRYALYLTIYLPSCAFANSLWKLLASSSETNFSIIENFIARFIPWVLVLLAIAWYLTIQCFQKAQDKEDRRFLGIMGWTLTGLIAFYCATFLMNGKSLTIIGPYLVLVTLALTFFLPPMMAYYIYCYNYMEYIFKRGVIYCLSGVLIITSYLSLIRPMGESMEKHFQLNFRMVEGLLVMVLVFFFDSWKRGMQEILNRIFFREKQYYRKVFSDISLKINSATYLDLESLLDDVARTISRAMNIREVSFIFFDKHQDKITISESTLAITAADIRAIVDYIDSQGLLMLNIYDLSENDSEILREMKKLKAFTMISIYNNEKKMIGIISIGKRRIRHQLRAEEIEMLAILANQMVIALENTRLAREKITLERKMYENEKLSSLGRLSASIAHEVKNPLSSIKAITQVMKEELPDDDANQEGLSLIIGEIDRLTRVVKKLLLFARPHSGILERVDVREVIRDVLLLLKHEAERKNIKFEIETAEEDILLLSDRDALSEIFFNLIHNAIQAIQGEGKIKIEKSIVAKEDSEMPLTLKVAIADNGQGIAASDHQHIFEPFYTTKQTGTGLGLTIVKHRLHKLKGEITVGDNCPGAVFEIFLPLQHADKVEIPERIVWSSEILQQ